MRANAVVKLLGFLPHARPPVGRGRRLARGWLHGLTEGSEEAVAHDPTASSQGVEWRHLVHQEAVSLTVDSLKALAAVYEV